MFQALCENKTIQKILIFLFVNGQGERAQLQNSLTLSCTLLSAQLDYLEKEGVIRLRKNLYELSPSYPCFQQLEQLLKTIYLTLSAEEKKPYYVVKEEQSFSLDKLEDSNHVLLDFWGHLEKVKYVLFHAKNKTNETRGWTGTGQGDVAVSKLNSHTLLFQEKGLWQTELEFSNVFRWVLDVDARVVSLEHLRRGFNHPVFLFNLAPAGRYSLLSVDSHVCGGDTYWGQVHFEKAPLRFNWRIIGPQKNEEIEYFYS